MPWIKVIPESEAGGELKEVYRKIKEQRKGEKILRQRESDAAGPPISPPCFTASTQRPCDIPHRPAVVQYAANAQTAAGSQIPNSQFLS
jgi:hypothetical protein